MIALPSRKFSVILADPPWNFKTHSAKGQSRSPEAHYSTLTVPQMRTMPVSDLAAKDCWLFMWTTSPCLQQAFDLMNAWGFKYSSVAFTWVKLNPNAPTLFFTPKDLHVGMGYTTRKNGEFCLLGRRGAPKRQRMDVHEIIISPRREHSRKPEETYRRIEAFASGPYVELFSRTTRPGWEMWGNEVGKFEGT